MKLSVFHHHIDAAARQTGRAIESIYDELAALNVSGAEIDYAALKQDESLPQRLSDHGLSAFTVNGFFDFGHGMPAQKGLEMVDEAARRGIPRVLLIPGFVAPGETIESVLPGMVAALRDVCAYARAVGVTACIEDFDSREAPYSTVKQLHAFFDAVPGLGCMFDTGNFIYSEEDAAEAYESLRAHVVGVHLKDRSPVCLTRGDEPMETILGRRLYPAPVGGGCLPIFDLLRALRADGFDGALAVEHYGAADQMSYLRASVNWLNEALDALGKEETL